MLPFLFLLSNDFNWKCEAPLNHSNPISGATLLSFNLYTRHGLRTPQDTWLPSDERGSWICDNDVSHSPRMNFVKSSTSSRRVHIIYSPKYVEFPPNCAPGDLLVSGMEELSNLGRYYRSFLIDEMKFLPSSLNKSLISVFSTYVTRAQQSAASFLNTFYPPEQPNEIIDILTGSSSNDFLFPSDQLCQDYNDAFSNFTSTEIFKERAEAAKEFYKPVYDQYNLEWDGINWLWIGDMFSSFNCTNQDLPPVITQEIFEQSQRDLAYNVFGPGDLEGFRGVGGAAILRNLISEVDSQINGTTSVRFRLYSGHDITIAGIMNVLGHSGTLTYPFASHLAVELWKKNDEIIIRFALNGDPVTIDLFDNNSEIEYNEFKEKIVPYLQFCKEEYP